MEHKLVSAEEEEYWGQRDFVLELLRQLPSQVFWKNKDSVYLGCNDAFAKALGLSSMEEVIGKTDYDLPTKKAESDAYRADDKYVMTSLQPKLNIEENQTLPDGRTVVLLTNKVPLLSKSGKVIGVLGIYSDITERKRAEENLRAAKELAEAANQAKTEFLKNMQHDFRTPFTGILGLADLMESQEPDPEKKENLGYIVESARTLLDHLNEIMEFIKVENAQLPILEKPFNLHEVLRDISSIFCPMAKSKALRFSCMSDEALPDVLVGDSVRTQRVLMNLIANAVKFTQSGYVKISVYPKVLSETKIVVNFEIEDSGIGIPKDQQEVIFERFNRLTSSYSGVYPGKGLGLRVVKQFLDELEGQCLIESTTGCGTTFKVAIPYRLPLIK